MNALVVAGALLAAPSADAALRLSTSWQSGDPAVTFRSVAAGVQGTVYVLRSNDFLSRHAADGFQESGSGGRGTAPGSLDDARAVAVDPGRVILVADFGHDRVARFDPGGGRFDPYGGGFVGSWPFERPTAVAVGGDGSAYYVAERPRRGRPRIARITRNGFRLGHWTTPVVTDLAVDRGNHVYAVLAAGRSGGRIVKYSPTGTTLDEWGSRVGARPGSFSAQGPGGIATISTSTVWVADPGNRRIQKFASDGGVVATCRLDRADPFRSPSDVATDGTATLWVADGSRMVVLSQVSSSSGDICRGAPIRLDGLRAVPSRFSPADTATSNGGGATLRFDLSRRGSIAMSVYRLATGHRPRFVGRWREPRTRPAGAVSSVRSVARPPARPARLVRLRLVITPDFGRVAAT